MIGTQQAERLSTRRESNIHKLVHRNPLGTSGKP
jgi:hypothetical protein